MLIVDDLVRMHRYRSQSSDCDSRYRNTMVQKESMPGTVHPTVNPGTGPTVGETVPAWHSGYTLRCKQGVKVISRLLLLVPCMRQSLRSLRPDHDSKYRDTMPVKRKIFRLL